MKALSDLDYVELYAKELKGNNRLYSQQKMLIDSQLKGSASTFKGMFSDSSLDKARKYLKQVGLL